MVSITSEGDNAMPKMNDVTKGNVKVGDTVAFMIGNRNRRALSGTVVSVGNHSVTIKIENYEKGQDAKEIGKRYNVRYGYASLQFINMQG